MFEKLIYKWNLRRFYKLVKDDSIQRKALALYYGIRALDASKPRADLRFNLEKKIIDCVRALGNGVQTFEELHSKCNKYRFDMEQNFFRYGVWED